MGMIYKRGEVFWIKYYSGGSRFEKVPRTTKQKKAERFLKNREGRNAARLQPLPRVDRITYDELARHLRRHYERGDHARINPGGSKTGAGRIVYLSSAIKRILEKQIERFGPCPGHSGESFPISSHTSRRAAFKVNAFETFERVGGAPARRRDCPGCCGMICARSLRETSSVRVCRKS